MTQHLQLAAAYLWIASLLCQLTLLVLQLRTYRRTGHSSLLALATGSALAILYLGGSFAASLYASKPVVLERLYLALVILFTATAGLGIWGARSLFRAFAAGAVRGDADSNGSSAHPELSAGITETPLEKVSVRALACLFRLWTFRRVDDVAALASERLVLLLGLLSLGLWMIIDRLRAGPDSSFSVFALPELGVVVLMLLVFAFVMARPSRPPLPYRQALFIVVALLPVLLALNALIDEAVQPQWAWAANLLLIVYTLVYLTRALRTFSGVSQPRVVILCVALACGYVWLDRTIYLDPSLWVQNDPDRNADSTWTPSSSESLLFDQQHRIDRALDNVATGEGARPSVYFVGFAGVASQRVFAEEIKLAARVIADRYDTAHRELLLINDRRDRDAYPLATVSGLRYALSGIARKMNVQRDILFLSLSSHGSDAPLLSVSNGALTLEQVTGENLAQALRESGIRWRIIVISACHAGAFIHGLEDPGTIIITAAAADKTSFGCSDDRDLTYFGEAFYRDALPKAQSLEEAFSLAKSAIAERETKEQITPSEPQAYFGADLDRMLSTHPMREPEPTQN
jgi:hypothetical protein